MQVYLNNEVVSYQIGIDTLDTDALDGLVLCHRLAVEGRDIDDVAVGLYQVDIGVLIDGYQPLSLLTPGDMGDVGITETVHLVVGCDALVVQVILVEVVGSQYEEIITSLTDALYVAIGQMVLPRTNLSI